MNNVENAKERFETILDNFKQLNISYTYENALHCIELTKIQMQQGTISAELFYQAKQIFIDAIEMPSLLEN